MKKLFLLFLLLLGTYGLYAQNEKETNKSESKTIEFTQRSGAFILKEFEDIGKVGSIVFKNIYVTDVLSKEKRVALRITTSSYSRAAGSTEYVGTLDEDELDACLKCLNHIKDNVLTSSPELYSEFMYKTRDGLSIGAYTSLEDKSWSLFIQTKSYTQNSIGFVKVDEIDNIIEFIQKAKEQFKAHK